MDGNMESKDAYRQFLESKVRVAEKAGFDVAPGDIHPMLKPHQRDAVMWACQGGRRALFEAFGLGKSMQQIEILRLCREREGGAALVVCPLGVRQEFRIDGEKLGVATRFIRTDAEIDPEFDGLHLTNYEAVRDGRLDPNRFSAVSLDEASVLRSFGSKTYQTFLTLFEDVRFRFVATATPSPNRYKELIHYAGFLGVMDTGQALAQPLTSKVLTPKGWKAMGDIAAGDAVIGRNGKPTEVIGVYPQGAKDIYRVTFSDGASTRCTAEHLWLTRTQYERNAAAKFCKRDPDADASHYWKVRETSDIAKTLRCTSTGSKNHQVPLVEAVAFAPQQIHVDPYLIGFLLGDGHLRQTSVNFTTADAWVVKEITRIVAGDGLAVRKNPHERADGQPNYDYNISGGVAGWRGCGRESNAVLRGLRRYGLLGKRAWEKTIPDAYLLNTVEVRMAVLQGLMDADGTIASDERNRTTRLCTTSRAMADAVVFITRSLGGTAQVFSRQGRTPNGEHGREQFIVTLRLPNGMIPFRLPRKADLVRDREKYTPKRYIVSVEPDGREDAQCIAVAGPEHLYVTDDFAVTHNTRWFKRDSTKANNLTLYPHKEAEFWLWVASWALFLQRPSDLGYSDAGYDLPEMKIIYHEVKVDHESARADRDGQGNLFRDAALGIVSASREKRDTVPARVAMVREILDADPDSHYLIWHDLEAERHAIQKAVPDAVSVYGEQDLDERERAVIDFSNGAIKYLSAKPVLAGSGCNFQRHCHKAIYAGIGFKFNDFIQSLHRIQRFLQSEPVEIHIVHAESEREVLHGLQTKWNQHNELVGKMSEIIREHGLSESAMAGVLQRSIGVERIEASGKDWVVANNDCVAETKLMDTDSVDLIVTSIPFANHYEYSPSYNDFGHTDNNDHFWSQMDFLAPELLRVLKPGRMACIHVKDRIQFGSVTGAGAPTVSPFHAEAIFHYRRHGFDYMGMITVVTDVVRENNQTYRLGYTEMCKDGTKMGVGSPEYIVILRKPQSDRSRGYADEPVRKEKSDYSLARWQVDAHAEWRSSGNRMLTADELAGLGPDKLAKLFTQYSLANIYDYQTHVRIGEALQSRSALPSTFMALEPGSHRDDVWHDVNRMLTLNGEQTRKGLEHHICPLQFDIVDRCIERWSMPGELVFDPFGGLFTVPVRALRLGRKGRASELSTSYFLDGVKYCEAAEREMSMPGLFDAIEDVA